MPHKPSRKKKWRDWLSYLEFLRLRAINTAFHDKERGEIVATPLTTHYPGMLNGEVLIDTRGWGSFQRMIIRRRP